KLDKLYDRNLLRIGEEPAAGQTIFLNSKRDKKPLLAGKTNPPPKEEIKQDTPVIKVIDDAQKKKQEEEAKAKLKEKQDNLDKVAKEAEFAMEKAEADAKRKEAEAESARLAAEVEKLKEELRLKEEAAKNAQNQNTNQTTVVKAEVNPSPAKKLIHKVVKGETLYAISKKYEVSIADIKKWNNLTSNDISIGQVLQIFTAN
ncbi:MAG: LysM peptidoglycan-binding domain-containing protein, partial [Bacteroidetes bacterium]|nr:LysM peptidoglycan-binding domain-containing protein [Bacteroidota bacterium]